MLNSHPAELPVYGHFPVKPASGEGCWILDEEGRRYLDFYGGHAVAVTGHCHPAVVRALEEQARRLLFYSNAVPLEVRERFLERLAQAAPPGLGKAFLVNSGAEANEQALALARRATGRSRVVVLEGGFHGRTLATLAVSGIESYRKLAAFSEAGRRLLEAADVCPFGDEEALERLVGRDTAAVLVEPVQGMGGARPAGKGFLEKARRFCDERGAALIFDEVQCGTGRTGAFTAAQLYGVTPDALTLAKGIASGLPLGAVLVGERLAQGVGKGDLGSTFGGAPLPCAAGAATLEVLAKEGLAEKAARRGRWLKERISSLPGVKEVRGEGLLLGVVLEGPAKEVQGALLREGRILTGSAIQPEVLRLLPPLTVGEEECALFLEELERVLAG